MATAASDMQMGIPADERSAVARGLSRLLADTYTLYLKTHNYHWNVTGPMFSSLHLMFENEYMELALAVDEIAERIRALGVRTPASYREFSALATITEDTDTPNATEMVRRLEKDQEAVVRVAREVFPVAEAAQDQSTVDLLTRRMQIHEKTAWMLRSVLE